MNRIEAISEATPAQINAASDANLRGVVRWSSPARARCVSAGGAVIVQHDLGVIPNRIDIEPSADSRTWIDADDRRAWNERNVSFHASAAGQYVVHAGVR